MNTQRLRRIAAQRKKRRKEQAHSKTLHAQAVELTKHLRGYNIEACLDGDQVAFTVREKLPSAPLGVVGAIVIAFGFAAWWGDNIPLINVAPSVAFIMALIAAGLFMLAFALLTRERTWSLTTAVSDPLIASMLERSETIQQLRLRSEPGRGELLLRQRQRLTAAITKHPQAILRRAPSLLDRVVAAVRGLWRC
ncbi:hypothetical protein ACXR2T_08040 [Leucobacter sp. HY1910]